MPGPFTLHFLGHHFAFSCSESAAEAAAQALTHHLSPSCRAWGVGKQHHKQEQKTDSVKVQPKCLGISVLLDYLASEEK